MGDIPPRRSAYRQHGGDDRPVGTITSLQFKAKICEEPANSKRTLFSVCQFWSPKVSRVESPFEQESTVSPRAYQAFRVPSNGMLLFIVLLGAVATTAAFLYRQHQPWVEIVGKDLLRTTAPLRTIALARDAVIQRHQNWVVLEDGKFDERDKL